MESSAVLSAKVARWEREGSPLPVTLVGGGRREAGRVYVVYWSGADRMKRTILSLVLWWGAAIATIVIPILHLFIPPILLFIGFFRAFFVSRQRSMILGGVSRCPFCSAEFELARRPERFPFDDICTRCSRHVAVERGGELVNER